MRTMITFLVSLFSFIGHAQQKKTWFISTGLDYRQYPIDVEDVPPGPLPHDNGLPSDDGKFWQTWSLHGRYGVRTKANWLFSISAYARYNLLHRTSGINDDLPYTQHPSVKKNFKFDVFVDVEKKILLKKNKERYFFAMAGIGLTNINSHWNVGLTDTVYGNPFFYHYEGTHFHFGPRLSLGYQFKMIKLSIDAYVIEDPIRANLVSLWTGGTLSYEMELRRKKR